MNFAINIIVFWCLISPTFTLLKKYDTISNHVMTKSEGTFFLNIKSYLYSLSITRLELIKEDDDLIFDSSDNDAVVSRDQTEAFGYIKENRFYGQFYNNGQTFFIDDSKKIGNTGQNAILYSLEDTFVDQSSGSTRDKERTVEYDPDSPQRLIDRHTSIVVSKSSRLLKLQTPDL